MYTLLQRLLPAIAQLSSFLSTCPSRGQTPAALQIGPDLSGGSQISAFNALFCTFVGHTDTHLRGPCISRCLPLGLDLGGYMLVEVDSTSH